MITTFIPNPALAITTISGRTIPGFNVADSNDEQRDMTADLVRTWIRWHLDRNLVLKIIVETVDLTAETVEAS